MFALHCVLSYAPQMQAVETHPLPKRKPIMFWASPALHAALMELARREEETASALLRRAVKRMIRQDEREAAL